ncbi:MAG: MBL fold metallo-hydrolase [Kordiimonadaceae bacterium]|nr:MBL fold metallo-hydrolase [Kordiimonadaceae bacterium]
MTNKNTAVTETVTDTGEVVDHRAPAVAPEPTLEYPFDGVPEGDNVIEVAKGIFWARIPLPWALDHINEYLFDEGDGWTVIDTGAQGKTGRAVWEKIEQTVMGGKPIKHLIATHMHPDHLGLAGWLVERHKAKFSMTLAEYFMAQHLWLSAAEPMPEEEIDYLFRMGVNPDLRSMIAGRGFGHFKKGVHKLPAQYTRLEDGTEIMIGGRKWRVIIGRGHSPEHACLLCLDEPLFIGGDQVLPEITSNVSVYAREPLANPLAHWLSSLERMKNIDADPMVLPSHGPVFNGLATRLDQLIESHLTKLARLHAYCTEAFTPIETFPVLFRRQLKGIDFFLAIGEAVSHHHLLESVGLAEREDTGDLVRFKATGTFSDVDILAEISKLPGIPLRDL